MPQPTVLCYDPIGAPYLAKLPALCALQHLRLRRLNAGQLGLTLGELSRETLGADPGGDALPEPILVLCHLGPGQLDRLLPALRKAGVPTACLKALLTPTNAGWTMRELYTELCRERERLG